MDTIVLDYSSGSVSILKHCKDRDVEGMIMDEGYRLGDCEWMSVESSEIKGVEV